MFIPIKATRERHIKDIHFILRSGMMGRLRTPLQEITKLLDGQPGIPNDTADGKGVHRVMTWDRQNARAI